MVSSIGLFVPRDEKETKGHKLSANLCTRAFMLMAPSIHQQRTCMELTRLANHAAELSSSTRHHHPQIRQDRSRQDPLIDRGG